MEGTGGEEQGGETGVGNDIKIKEDTRVGKIRERWVETEVTASVRVQKG